MAGGVAAEQEKFASNNTDKKMGAFLNAENSHCFTFA